MVRYADYNKRKKSINSKIACTNCSSNKARETSLIRYGVENYAQTKECQDKMMQTMKNRYGVKHALQNKCFYDSFKKTCIDKYGDNYRSIFLNKAFDSFYKNTGYTNPAKSPAVKAKMAETSIYKYGVDNPSKSPLIKEKIKNHFIAEFGCDNPNKLPEVREKISQTLYKNHSQKSSVQQQYICDLYKGIINYPISSYNVDVYLDNDNLAIEYDGGGHNLNVITGRETQEEHDQKEIIRNNIIKREGYKQMRIISSKDILPSDTILLQMLDNARQYFKAYPSHSWIEFNIDNSIVRNAENKNGVPYDFSELRKISKSESQEVA